MGAQGIVVPPGQNPGSPGRSFSLKLRGGETGDSIMMFEETIPAGTKSTFHLHHDSDEVAYVLSGEVTFKIGDAVTVGGPGTCAFMPRGVPPRDCRASRSRRSSTPGRTSINLIVVVRCGINDGLASNLAFQSRSRERPESARLARCTASPRRSLD